MNQQAVKSRRQALTRLTSFQHLSWLTGSVLLLLAALSSPSAAQTTQANELVNETFRDATTFGWRAGGRGPRCLTARGTTQPGSIPVCGPGSGPEDISGQGALRLTNEIVEPGSGQQTFAFYNFPIPARNGLVITFDYFAYGGQDPREFGSFADGITFFLFNGNTPNNQAAAGAFGGSLGYAQKLGTENGLVNGYVGVGLDEFGNFANDREQRGANSPSPNNCPTPPFPAAATSALDDRITDSVTVRGAGNGQQGYCFLANSGSLVPQANAPNGIDNPNVPATGPREAARRRVRITLTPDFVLTVEIDRNGGNNFQRVVGPLRLNQFPNQDPPETFKFGFASSTGDATNIHEIQNLVITSNAPPPDLQLTKRSNIDNVEPGGTVEYTLTVRNVGQGATTANATITDTLPPGFSFDSFRGAGWNCTADGRVVTCVYIGDPNSTNSATDPIISPNESQSVVVRVNAPDTPGNFTNTATVATTGDENPNNNTATDTVSIGGDTDGSGRPGRPRLRLVKRITRVNTTTFTDLVDEPGFRDDNPGIWPARLQPVGLPQIDDQSPLQSGDEVEYTVYFISDGGRNARNVNICDPIPQGTTFIRNSFGTGQGISLNLNRAEIPLTNASDPDQGTFFSPLAPVTAPCPNTNNPNGSVFLQLGNIQNDAPNNAGFVRFRVKID